METIEQLQLKIKELEQERNELIIKNNEFHSKINMYEHIDDVVILFDKLGNYLHMSPPRNNKEYKPLEQIIGKNLLEVLPKNEALIFQDAINKVFYEKKSVTISYALEIENSILWYDGRLSLLDKNKVLFVGRNITSYKEKEQELLIANYRHKAIFNNSAQAFLLINSDFEIESYNEKIKILSEKLTGIKFSKKTLIHEIIKKVPEVKKSIEKAFHSIENTIEVKLARLWYSSSFSPVFGPASEIIGVFISIVDINKRKLAEKRLLKSKTNLKAMFDSSQRLYHLIDSDYKILSFNKLAKNYFKNEFGIDLVEGTRILNYIFPEKIDIFKESIDKALNGEKVLNEGWFFEQDKAVFWAEYLYLPVFNDKNKIIGVAYSIVNINEKHNFIVEIEENETKYRNLVENLPLTTYLSESNDVNEMYYISPKVETLLGYESNNYTYDSKFLASLIFNEDRQRVQDIKKTININNPSFFVEYRAYHANGKQIWLREEGHLIFNQKNKPKYIQGILNDISLSKVVENELILQKQEIEYKNEELSALNEEFKATNDELKNNQVLIQNSKDAFQKIFEQSPDAILISDDTGVIVDCNEETLNLVTEIDRDNIINKSAFSFINVKDRYKIIEAFKNSQPNKTIKDIEVSLLTNSSEAIYVEFSLSPILGRDSGGIFYIIILKDITARKKSILALKKSEKELKETNTTKDKFFSIIAHDLKNPFNNIMGFSELLMSDLHSYSPTKLKEIVSWIYESSVQGFNLLENLLNWSRSQTGRLDWSPEAFDLVKLIKLETELLNQTAKKKGVNLEVPTEAAQLVFADMNMVKTVIRNLVSNALKFTERGGSVKVILRLENDNFLRVCVIDSGIGISPQAIEDIFRIDKHLSTLGTDNEAGTGLGLILCKEFIEKHGGNLKVDSKVGEGSNFHFTLPIFEPK